MARKYKRLLDILPRESEIRDFRWMACDSETHGFDGDTKFVTWAIEDTTQLNGMRCGYMASWDAFFSMIHDNRQNYEKTIIIIHNLGFDIGRATNTILHYLTNGHTFQLIESGDNHIIGMIWKDPDGIEIIRFHDSLALFPNKLSQFTDGFAIPQYKKQEGAIDFEHGEIPDIDNPVHLEYGLIDSLGLLSAMVNYDRILWEHFGVHAGMTAASTAMKAWRVTIPEGTKYYRLSADNEELARESYTGGYVALGSNAYDITTDNSHFDRNSSYPASMREKGVPYGTPIKTYGEIPNKAGIYNCRVIVPEGIMPPVPLKHYKSADDKHPSLRWPSGEFKTTITSVDINNARKSGCTVKVIDGIAFPNIIFPFNDFVTKCESMRLEYKEQPTETVAKLMQNSLYGKFGAKNTGKRVTLTKEGASSPTITTGNGILTMYRDEVEEERDAMYMLPHWAAFITANARDNLHDIIREIGHNNFIYGDTDSIVMPSSVVDGISPDKLGNAYGQWKLEKTYTQFRAIAPKVYVGIVGSTLKGKVKGIPKKQVTDKMLNDLLSVGRYSGVVDYKSVTSLASVIKGKELLTDRTRSVSTVTSSKSWTLDNGKVRPFRFSEL